jgi:hypothetical protein
MNQEQTLRHKELVAEINEMVKADLQATYHDRCINAYVRYKELQRAFLEPLEAHGINTDAEKVMIQ